MNRQELMSNSGYWIAKIQIDLYNHIEDYMKKNKLSRTQLAEELGVSKGYITQVLNGDFNHRLSKLIAGEKSIKLISYLVELSLAIGRVPEISFKKLENVTW